MSEPTATNPQTGEKVVFRGGQWVPLGSAPAPATNRPPAFIPGTPNPSKAAADARANNADIRDQQRLILAQQAAAREAAKANKELQGGTEAENKASSFYIRAFGANKKYQMQEDVGLGPRSLVGQAMYDWAPNALNSMPGWMGNSPRRQVSDAAQEEFVAATLRQDSGAAIPPAEMSAQKRIYFPQPGDGQDVIKAKEQARARALAGLVMGTGKLRDKAMTDAQRLAPRPAPKATSADDTLIAKYLKGGR